MPFGDRTGPRDVGPATGRGLGFCTGFSQPGRYTPPGGWYGRPGGGASFGGGGGWGHRNWYRATGLTGWQRAAGYGGYYGYPPVEQSSEPATGEAEEWYLRRQAEDLERALGRIRSRLEEMEKDED